MEQTKKIAIMTDTSSGITPEQAKELGVYVLPLPFCVNGEQKLEDVDLKKDEFFTLLKDGASVSTSQPAVGDLMECWSNLLKEHDEIVHIPISSGLSQSCETAKTFAKEKEFDGKVFVADVGRISGMLKEDVLNAIKLRDRGYSAREIRDYLDETRADFTAFAGVDTLKYFKKGGRLSAAVALIGSILNIKPIVKLHTEKVDKVGIARNMKKAKESVINLVKEDIKNRLAEYEENGELVFYIAHTNARDIADEYAEEVKKAFPKIEFRSVEELSLVISCHTGPGMVALAVVRTLK